MSKGTCISVSVSEPLDDTQSAMIIILSLLKKNNINLKFNIDYDYSMEECGLYRPFAKGQEYSIVVNPSRCKAQEDVTEQNFEEPFCPGSHCDITLFGITVHEFCHLLQYKVYPSIIEDYEKNFPTKRFILNKYSNNEIHDELAEIQTLYISNPYLLKLISKDHFNFCKKYFKSPVSCTEKRCFYIFKTFPIQVKNILEHRWGIVYNYSLKKFKKIN